MCLFAVVFVALFAKLSSQKILRVDSPYLDYAGRESAIQVFVKLRGIAYIMYICYQSKGHGT